MRRALLVLAAVPALALGDVSLPPTPTAGQITYPTVANTSIDGYINKAECQAGTITLKWAIAYTTGSFANVASYQLYASDQPDNTTVNTGACPTQPNDKSVTGLHAGAIGSPITTGLTDPSANYDFDTSMIATVAGLGDCTATGSVLMLCVQAKDGSGTLLGAARTRLTVDVSTPGAPSGVGVSSGDGALNVSWSAPTGSPAAESYQVDASPLGTTIPGAPLDTTPLHRSPRVTGTSYRLGGLVNGNYYQVVVRAYSTADNPSTDTAPVQGLAQPVADFWGEYKDSGGREAGGCSSGFAGPVGLGILVATLALVRRRRS